MIWLAIAIGVVAILMIFTFMMNKWADKANLKIAVYVIDAEENTGKEIQIPYPYPYVTKVLSEIYPLVEVVGSSMRVASAQLDSGMLLAIAEDENNNTIITAFTSLEEQRRSNAELGLI